jgi:hypothetical protein
MRTTAALLLLSVAGCGLSDYEARMLEAQARADRADKEAELLDEPVGLRGGDAPDLFFRPPRGIAPQGTEEKDPSYVTWFYPRDSNAKSPLTAVVVALTVDDFRFLSRALYTSEPPQPKRREVTPPGRDPLAFDTFEYTNGKNAYLTCVLRNAPDGVQVAITYRMDRERMDKDRNDFDAPSIRFSLESLALGADAARAKQALARYKVRPRQPQMPAM